MGLQKWERLILSGIVTWILTIVMIFEGTALCQGTGAPLSLSATIAGTVVDDRDSKPVQGAIVVVEVLGGTPVDPQGIQTGQDGSFKLAVLPGSQYRILAQKQGFMSLSRVIGAAGAAGGAAATDVGEFRLIAQAAIAGRVFDSEEKALIGASVQLNRVSLEGLTTSLTPVTVTTTNDLGEYRIFGLEPGTYYVSALFQDLADAFGLRQKVSDGNPAEIATEDHAVTYYPGSPDVEAASPIRLKEGMTLSNLDIRVTTAQSYTVGGSVTSLPANSPPFMVRLQPVHPGSLGVSRGYTLTPGHSSFLFKSIPPGDYVVRADIQTEERHLSARREVVVGRAPVDGVLLDLRAPFPIVGKVSMEGAVGAPRNLEMSLNSVDRQFRASIIPKAEGRFQIEGAGPDRYSISASDESGVVYVKSVALDAQPVGIKGIDISDPNHVLRIQISDKAGRIEGTALDGQQHPIAGGLAILMGPDTQDSHSQAAVIGNAGKFSFKSLAPGKYRISCFSDLKMPADATWDVQKKVREEGKEISISEGDHQQFTLDAVEADAQQ